MLVLSLSMIDSDKEINNNSTCLNCLFILPNRLILKFDTYMNTQ